MRQLPIVKYEGKQYYFDERLKQIRNIKNPHDYQDLNEFEMEYFKNLSKGVELKKFNVSVALERGDNSFFEEQEILAENEQQAVLDFCVNSLGVCVEEVREVKGKLFNAKEIQVFRGKQFGEFNFSVLGTNRERFKETKEVEKK